MSRIVLLTGDASRHCYVAQRLSKVMNLVGIVTEKKRAPVENSVILRGGEEAGIIARHLQERTEAERRIIMGSPGFPAIDRLVLPEGGVNSEESLEWIESKRPHYVVLYGTGIIKEPLLGLYEDRIINMHLGLSPYYRGAGTNFWPLVDRRPECLGVTIHLAVRKVDAGPILAQIRPKASEADRAHELGTKAIVAGTEALIAAIDRYSAGQLDPVEQGPGRGIVYRRKDFSADAVLEMWRNFETGMMRQYLENLEERCAEWPIRELE